MGRRESLHTTYSNDPTYPPRPDSIAFAEPIPNVGPDADKFRDTTTGSVTDASQLGITASTFTPHLSINGIVFDRDSILAYDQDINTIANPMFKTNINAVTEFIVENVFLRISSKNEMFDIKLHLDPSLPPVQVNEFIVWEILEPLIQNSIDHAGKNFVTIKVSTRAQ